MSRVLDFLNGLDNYELAFFAKYKRNTYMKETQKIISDYLLEKGYSKSKIDRLIADNPKSKLSDHKERCPRCYSDKIRKNKVEWTNAAESNGIEARAATWDAIGGRVNYKDEVICNVCGYWIKDPNHQKPLPNSKKIMNGIWDILIGVLRNIKNVW
ncbi:hypothetical protein [Yeosuana marina]|uniref:hypothetical protein n=1 Tax=Yeosuana marina TaxID=1565536 RepID=UPI0014214E89|nr:hypothetical protein [Yeosuana marina]